MFVYQLNWKDKVKSVFTYPEFDNLIGNISLDDMQKIQHHKEASIAATDETERSKNHDKANRLKSKLIKFCFLASGFEGDVRNAKNAILRGTTMIDIDGIPNDVTPEEYWQQKFHNLDDDVWLRVLLVYKTPSGHGLRIVAKANIEMNLQDNMNALYDALDVEPELRDTTVFNPDRVSYGVHRSYIIFASEDFVSYDNPEYDQRWRHSTEPSTYVSQSVQKAEASTACTPATETDAVEVAPTATTLKLTLGGIPYQEYVDEWMKLKLNGKVPEEGIRNTTLYSIAHDFRSITDSNEEVLKAILPRFGLSEEEFCKTLRSALSRTVSQMSPTMRDVMQNVKNRHIDDEEIIAQVEDIEDQIELDEMYQVHHTKAYDASCDGTEPNMWMVVLGVIAPIIGFLATRIRLWVHKEYKHLNNTNFVVGEAGSNKGQMDEIVDLWLTETNLQEDAMRAMEENWEVEKREKVNKAEQPKELKLKRRIFSFRSSITKIIDRMKNIAGMHGFSYGAEGDMLAQGIKSAFSDLTVIIRAAFDNSSYSQDYKSLNSTNVFLKKVMWNFVTCCTPDVIIRMFRNLTNGSLHRIGIYTTPDNTYAKLRIIAPRSEESKQTIIRVAHLLPLLQGDVALMKLEERSKQWIEVVRCTAAKENDKVKARMRMRIPIIAMTTTCELMLTEMVDWLYEQIDTAEERPEWAGGCKTAEEYLTAHPEAAAKWLPQFEEKYLDTFEVIADYLMANTLHFFGSRIQKAYDSPDYVTTERTREGKNDGIYDALPQPFTYADLTNVTMQKTGKVPTSNELRQKVKNWKRAALIEKQQDQSFRKLIG